MPNNTTQHPRVSLVSFNVRIQKPEQLLSFSPEYLRISSEMKTFIRSNNGKEIILPFARVEAGGQHVVKEMKCRITEIDSEKFIFKTPKDFSGIIHDELTEIEIKFNNVMGWIPVLPKKEKINPFVVNSKMFSSYFSALKEVRELMTKCLYEDHSATAVFSFGEEKGNQKKFIECEIIKVNKSNFRYKNARTYTEVSLGKKVDYINVNILPITDIAYFINNKYFLEKFSVTFGVKNHVNQHDD